MCVSLRYLISFFMSKGQSTWPRPVAGLGAPGVLLAAAALELLLLTVFWRVAGSSTLGLFFSIFLAFLPSIGSCAGTSMANSARYVAIIEPAEITRTTSKSEFAGPAEEMLAFCS